MTPGGGLESSVWLGRVHERFEKGFLVPSGKGKPFVVIDDLARRLSEMRDHEGRQALAFQGCGPLQEPLDLGLDAGGQASLF